MSLIVNVVNYAKLIDVTYCSICVFVWLNNIRAPLLKSFCCTHKYMNWYNWTKCERHCLKCTLASATIISPTQRKERRTPANASKLTKSGPRPPMQPNWVITGIDPYFKDRRRRGVGGTFDGYALPISWSTDTFGPSLGSKPPCAVLRCWAGRAKRFLWPFAILKVCTQSVRQSILLQCAWCCTYLYEHSYIYNIYVMLCAQHNGRMEIVWRTRDDRKARRPLTLCLTTQHINTTLYTNAIKTEPTMHNSRAHYDANAAWSFR